jgi:sugar lactone lactonase YvrE
MIKLTYFLSVLVVTSLVSCEKKNATPSTTTTKTTTTDTLSGKIFTYAGNGYDSAGRGGYSGDGGQATKAELYHPFGVAVDGLGNIYISDLGNFRVRKVNTQGIISTFAGNGSKGYSGDGGSAQTAELFGPFGIAVDSLGNVYIADNGNNNIRLVNTSGTISTFAGNGIGGYSGDGGAAINAEINLPEGLAVDAAGNVYIADYGNACIRKVNTQGIISTIAGRGVNGLGDGGPAIDAALLGPYGVATDGLRNIYVADYGNNRIRKIDTSGIISTVAGNGFGAPYDGGYSGDGGPANAAELYNPTAVVLDKLGNIYIADAENSRIRMVNTNGIISTIAGTGVYGVAGDGGSATAAEIGNTQGIAIDGRSNLYITDAYFNRVRIIYK